MARLSGRSCITLLVKVPFSLFLALRYLKPKRTFVSVITIISVLGVTLGITVLIVVISVMRGFDQELRDRILSFDAHVLVTSDTDLQNWRPMDEKLQKVPGVVATAPYVQGPVLVDFNHLRITPNIRAIDPDREEHVTDIHSSIVEGKMDLTDDNCIMGVALADQLGAHVGDQIQVYSPKNINAVLDELEKAEKQPGNHKTFEDLKQMILPTTLTISGIFKSGRYAYDAEYILVPLHVGQEVYELGDGLNGISVRTTDAYKADEVKTAIEGSGVLIPGAYPRTWMEMNAVQFDAIRLERNVMFIILMFLIVIASFCIMTTLITVTVQKTREIGVMKALGARSWQIVFIFLAQGVVVGFFGNLTGLAIGMSVIRWRNEFKDWLGHTLGIEIFPARIYQFSKIPALVVPQDVTIICISAFVICSVAALIPAYVAARLEPVKALRTE